MGCGGSSEVKEGNEEESKTELLNEFSRTKLIKENYEMLSIIGSGSFGKVRIYRSNACQKLQFAVKTMKKEGIERPLFNCFKNEINILRTVDHPNIVSYIESYENDCFVHVVTEYLKGKDLQNVIRFREERPYDEREICHIIQQLLFALKYLHLKGIVHRDLKPENLLFGEENTFESIKIIDFGLSTYVGAHDRKSCGSPYFMSPELIEGKFDPKSDVWAVGVILYQMLTGSYPFVKEEDITVLQAIKQKKLDLGPVKSRPEKFSNECIDFLKKLLTKEVHKRPSSEEALEHEWFKKIKKIEEEELKKNTREYNKEQQEKEKRIKIMKISFKAFAMKNIFQKEILYLVSRMLDDEELKAYKTLFIESNKTCSGTITLEEFLAALGVNGNQREKEEEDIEQTLQTDDYDYQSLFEAITFHKKDCLSYTEFIACLFPAKKIDNDILSVAFKFFEDPKDKGYVSNKSLISGIESFGIKPRIAEINLFFSKNHIQDNKMGLDQFIALYKKDELSNSSMETARHY
ncbi:MAG: serine/threonine-protein kinase [archaeon]|nr:serine/threonine-protein kinase [archaeon]